MAYVLSPCPHVIQQHREPQAPGPAAWDARRTKPCSPRRWVDWVLLSLCHMKQMESRCDG